MKLWPLFGFAVLSLFPITKEARANGSAWQTGVPASGNVAAATGDEKKGTTVAIEDERLTIDLHQEFAAVEVRYKMRNEGAGLTQGFYFPTERWSRDLEDYEIKVDGKPVKSEEISTGEKVKEAIEGWGLDPAMRNWRFSKIPFGKDQTREVTITYRQRYARESAAISDSGSIGNAVLRYSLSPAATWAGPIGTGKVQVNVLHPLPEDVRIVTPKERFKKINDRRYEWSFENLEPTLADDLEVVAQAGFSTDSFANDASEAPTWSAYVTQNDKYYVVHEEYSVTTSSTLPPQNGKTYEADNIKKGEEGLAWVEGDDGDGIGEHLDLTVKNPLPLAAIYIVPGYASHRTSAVYLDDVDRPRSDLWWKNNRVASLKVTLNGNHSFNVSIPDEEFTEPYPIPVRGYDKPVKTIRLEITGVHRGTAFRDTCISLVSLKARLAKKPKIQPSR